LADAITVSSGLLSLLGIAPSKRPSNLCLQHALSKIWPYHTSEFLAHRILHARCRSSDGGLGEDGGDRGGFEFLQGRGHVGVRHGLFELGAPPSRRLGRPLLLRRRRHQLHHCLHLPDTRGSRRRKISTRAKRMYDGSREAMFPTTPLYHGGIVDCFRA